jgi:hypothetical protein
MEPDEAPVEQRSERRPSNTGRSKSERPRPATMSPPVSLRTCRGVAIAAGRGVRVDDAGS